MARARWWRSELGLALLVTLAFAGFACAGSGRTSPDVTGAAVVASTSEGARASEDRQSFIGGNAFEPEIVVAAGSTVTWANHDAVLHTVAAVDGAWHSELLDFGVTYTKTFEEPGRFEYYCSIHPDMLGAVVVE